MRSAITCLTLALFVGATGLGGLLPEAGAENENSLIRDSAGGHSGWSEYSIRANSSQQFSVADGLLPEITEYTIKLGVPYVQGAGEPYTMNIYMPEGEGPFPVIVYIHGGAWVGGHRDGYGDNGCIIFGASLDAMGCFYAKRGIAGFSINYTLGSMSWPQAIQDVIQAIRHIRENADGYNIDPERVAVLGHSAGGHLASLVGTLSGDEPFLSGISGSPATSRVSLVMEYFGPTDFQFVGEQGPSYEPFAAIQGFLGGPYESNSDIWLEASPAAHVTSDDPVFVIAHGTDDGDVSFPISESFRDRLIQAGVETHFVRIEGGGHGFNEEENLSVRYILEPLLRRVFDLQPPDPTAELEHLRTYINSLPSGFFSPKGASGDKIKRALSNKVDEVLLKVEAGFHDEALDKLRHDLRAKIDAGAGGSWIGDPAIQSRLFAIVDHIIEGIQFLQQNG